MFTFRCGLSRSDLPASVDVLRDAQYISVRIKNASVLLPLVSAHALMRFAVIQENVCPTNNSAVHRALSAAIRLSALSGLVFLV